MVFAESFLLELLGAFAMGIGAFISDLVMAPRSATRFSSPATSWRRALRKAVPLLLTTSDPAVEVGVFIVTGDGGERNRRSRTGCSRGRTLNLLLSGRSFPRT